jgi:MFS family permease
LTLLSILTGLFAEEAKRGKVFGFLSLAGTLGASVGGLTTGGIADRWGYPTMFAALSPFSILLPLAALLLKDKKEWRGFRTAVHQFPGTSRGWGAAFTFCSWPA